MLARLILSSLFLFIAISCKQRVPDADLQGTSKKQLNADQILKQKVLHSNVKGKWISVALFSEQKQELFIVEGVDLNKVDRSKSISLLKSEPSAHLLSQALEEGAPIVVTTMPTDASALAACMREHDSPGVMEILNQFSPKFKKSSSVVVIDANADEFIFAHELHHWRDFQPDEKLSGQSVFKRMSDRVVEVLNAMIVKKIFDRDEAMKKYTDLTQLYIETRGHQAMIIRAKYLHDNNLKYYDVGQSKLMQFSQKESLKSYAKSVNDIYFSIYRDQLASNVRIFFQQATKKKVAKIKEFSDFYVGGDLIPWEHEKSISLTNIVLK